MPDEAPKLLLDRPASLIGLLLHDAKRPELALCVDDLLDGIATEGADQLVLEIRHADEDIVERTAEEALLSLVAEADESAVESLGPELAQEPPDVRRTAHRQDRDVFCREVPAGARRERLDCQPVADSLHEHDGVHVPSLAAHAAVRTTDFGATSSDRRTSLRRGRDGEDAVLNRGRGHGRSHIVERSCPAARSLPWAPSEH